MGSVSERLAIEPICNALGARVRGVDLSQPLSDSARDAIVDALAVHHLLVFSDQSISADEQVAFCRIFGDVQTEGPDGKPYNRISNDDGRGILGDGAISFHSDFAFLKHPVEAICLYGEKLPKAGTSTFFASNVRPLEKASADERREWSSYTVRNVVEFSGPPGQDIVRYRVGPAGEGAIAREGPLVMRHPKSGVEILYCFHQQTEGIVELTRHESEALLEHIFDRVLYSKENTYEHRWREGDLLIWDNLALQHGRPAAAVGGGERTMRRVTVSEHDAVAELSRLLGFRLDGAGPKETDGAQTA